MGSNVPPKRPIFIEFVVRRALLVVGLRQNQERCLFQKA
jgi:hypothetical protein